jgi:hypothetical protein
MQRTSRHPRKADGISAGTYGNLGFETIPDVSWAAGNPILNGGNGFRHAFENFSQYPLGLMPAGGTKTIRTGGVGSTSIAAYGGINKPVQMITDGAGTDEILVTFGDSGLAVAAPLVGRYECHMVMSDVSRRAFFGGINAANTRIILCGISNGMWILTNAAGAIVNCADLAWPAFGVWYHVELIYEFATDTTRLVVNNVPSAITGKCIGGAAADISNMACVSGYAAVGLGTPANVYTIDFAAVDFNGVPDYVENRSENDLPRSFGDFAGAHNFSFGETANNVDLVLAQNATVTRPTRPRFTINVWLSDTAFATARAIAPDVIPNGLFEVNINGWAAGGVPGHPQFVGTIAQDVFNFHGGAASLRIMPAANLLGAATTDLIAVQPGQNYTLAYWSGWFAGVGNETIAAAVSFYDNAGLQIGSTKILGNHKLTNAWVNFQDNFASPPNCVFMRVHFMGRGTVFSDICVDDVTCFSNGLPRMFVLDVASGTFYFATAEYKSGGWYTLATKINRTGNNIQWNIIARCGHGWIVYDNARID